MGIANGCCAAPVQQQQQLEQQQQQQQQQLGMSGALHERIDDLLSAMVSVTKAQKLLQDLQSPDESQQLTAAMEMCQLLVMGNEDTLAGFPVKQAVPALVALLRGGGENFDLMHHACRALTYLMEALPRSSSTVVEAAPVLLEKLQIIQCVDVAEQALQALNMLSRQHGKALLHAGGVMACLNYIDFLSISAQRAALVMAANCCQNMSKEDFSYVRDSLSLLSARLNHEDKKCVESTCLCFSRLVDCYQTDERLLKEIAAHDLLSNVLRLLMLSPPMLMLGTRVNVLHMLVLMCATCPDLAIVLLKHNIADTLCFLLTGPSQLAASQSIDLQTRSAPELFEIVSLVGELMPKLPQTGVFAINSVLYKTSSRKRDAITWQWQDDGIWRIYSSTDSRAIEACYQAGEEEVTVMNDTYIVNFTSMHQVHEETGMTWPVQRRVTAVTDDSQQPAAQNSDMTGVDSRAEVLKENPQLAAGFIKALVALLYEVYNASAAPTVRHKCLLSILRMLCSASPHLLRDVLTDISVSSHLATMASSQDLKIVVAAIQMAHVLMEKLPDVFSTYFQREGVVHQMHRLLSEPRGDVSPKSPAAGGKTGKVQTSFSVSSSPSTSRPDLSFGIVTEPPATEPEKPLVLSQLKLSEVFKKRKAPKRIARRSLPSADDLSPPEPSVSSGVGLRASWGAGQPPSVKHSAPSGKSAGREKSGIGTKSFLNSLNPSRWVRSSPTTASSPALLREPQSPRETLTLAPSSANLLSSQRDRVREWICEQVNRFCEMYFPNSVDATASSSTHCILSRLQALAARLQVNSRTVLQEMAAILEESDVSPFELLHSNIVSSLLSFLTAPTPDRDTRLRQFLHVFYNCPESVRGTGVTALSHPLVASTPLSTLLARLMACVHHLEQFQLKVHEVPGGSNTPGRGSNAVRFFSAHKLKCNLQRHPLCTTLRQWRGGPIRIDPLALVQAIERCLIMRGFGRPRLNSSDVDGSDDDNSDEEVDDTMAAVSLTQNSMCHRLEFLIGDHVLPYNMTVYQAIRQYAAIAESSDVIDLDTESDHLFASSTIWTQTHTIWYRTVCGPEGAEVVSSPKKTKSESISRPSKSRKDTLWTEGQCDEPESALNAYLMPNLPASVTVSDPSLEVLALLRVLHALSYHWYTLYEVACSESVTGHGDFVSSKLTAKANRQLQDPLILMTGNLPLWLSELGSTCQFLLPFESRQTLLYATRFDRDRAMQRLVESATGDANQLETSSERLVPRLERRRKVISRDDVLKHAEKAMEDLGTGKPLLEIQYDSEVGTGLGPTLEFYALVSRELQRADLDLWRGDSVSVTSSSGEKVLYVFSPVGLFPAPLGHHAKTSVVTRVKSKFHFLGRFMAKALMDSRLLDLPLSVVFYKWLLGEERCLDHTDLVHIDPAIARSVHQLYTVLREKQRIDADHSHTAESRQLALDSLTVDGCSVSDLDLDFVLPGYPHVELKKGGKDIPVTLESLEEYLKLIVHWSLVEGVRRQMEAFREGFESLVSLSSLNLFYADELEQLFCGNREETWDVKYLSECCRPDHGFTLDSPAIRMLFDVLSSYDNVQQRGFVQFVTGSPKLPVGGLRSLSPQLTIVCKTVDGLDSADAYLPSVMTCVNYLKLPDYSSADIMRQRLATAISEGQMSFHLS